MFPFYFYPQFSPMTFTMFGSGHNVGGSPNPNAGNTTSGTTTGTILATPLLPYMVGLSLPDFNQFINDPICHDVGWPDMPTKLPSDLPSLKVLLEKILQTIFDLSTCGFRLTPSPMTLSVFGCSNECLLVKLLIGMLIRPHPLVPPLKLLPWIFYLISNFPFIMKLVPNF